MQKPWGIQMLAPTAVDLAITSVIAGFSWKGESKRLGQCQARKAVREEDFRYRWSSPSLC